jgi:monofunctional biosynthetic peptidoglycan transglycosylase
MGMPRLAARAALSLGALMRGRRLDFPVCADLLPDPAPPPFPKRALPLRIAGWLLLAVVYIHMAYVFATSILIVSYRHVDPSVTVLMAYRKWVDGWKIERPRILDLKQVPSWQRRMLVAVEDGNFYEHHGIDPEAVKRAYEINSRLKRPLYGGSTLSMQVARTLFLVPVKSYVRKYFEVIATLELELLLPKDRILELYFGYAEWGKGVFGIDAAARHYYGRGVNRITRDEGARLIALLSSPIKYNPDTLRKSAILRERYSFLSRGFVAPRKADDAPAAGAAPAPTASAPLPTPEPGEELPEATLQPAAPDPSPAPAPDGAPQGGGPSSAEPSPGGQPAAASPMPAGS